jgi:hypothetical protein
MSEALSIISHCTAKMKLFAIVSISSIVVLMARADKSYQHVDHSSDEDFMAGWPEEDVFEFRQYYS